MGKILLIEDSDADAALIEQAFRRASVANPIVRASTGLEAIKYLAAAATWQSSERPPFVLLDIKLPDLSGYEVLRWIRLQQQLRDLPVVVVTGSEFAGEPAAVKQAGANAFFRKNLTFEKLVELIRSTNVYWSLITGV